MRFVDEAIITVRSGKGGHGCVSFRREKFVPRGGPDGGDGGEGGSVYLRASRKLHSLYDFRLKRLYEAQNGQPGQGSQCNGRKGQDLVLDLPIGSQVYHLQNGKRATLLCDLENEDDMILIAAGGRGGRGNEFFKSATMRAPRFAQSGEPGEEFTLAIELKILADCGLLGLPNAGKSSFIRKISAARPKVANYPFTTIEPNLGVLLDEQAPGNRMIIADIPGLVEGAHTGYGLGHRFLKHVERTRFLVHIASVEDIPKETPLAPFELIDAELALFDPELRQRQQIRVVNKIDLLSEEELLFLKEEFAKLNVHCFFISILTGEGIDELVSAMWKMYESLPPTAPLQKAFFDRFSEEEEEGELEDGDEGTDEVEWVYIRE